MNILSGIFAVPNCIIDKYINICNEAQIKVLLLLLRHSEKNISIQNIMTALNLSSDKARESVAFWVRNGLLSETDFEKIVDNNIPARKNPPNIVSTKLLTTSSDTNESDQKESQTIQPKKSNIVRFSKSPCYPSTVDAQKRYQESDDIKNMIKHLLELLPSKSINNMEICTIVMLYDWAGIKPDVFFMIIEYCKKINIKDMRRIQNICFEFIDNGVNSHEYALEYITKKLDLYNRENLIKRAFGISGRRLIDKELEYITLWFDEYKSSLDLIKIAYERSIQGTGSLSFPYINKILSDWKQKNITTSEQAYAEIESKPKETQKPNYPSKYRYTPKSRDILGTPTFNIKEVEQWSKGQMPT